MERKWNMRQPHGGGRIEEKCVAMHCTEMKNEECMRHDVKRKEKHGNSMAVYMLNQIR